MISAKICTGGAQYYRGTTWLGEDLYKIYLVVLNGNFKKCFNSFLFVLILVLCTLL